MHDAFENEIRELMAAGGKIAAIKRFREETGARLAEAKAAVESLEAGASITQQIQPQDFDFTNQIVRLLGRGEKSKR